MSFMLIYVISGIIGGVIFGFATDAIITNKGYNENWFWWGFFFGLIALIVAACKPQCVSYYENNTQNNITPWLVDEERLSDEKSKLNRGYWKCTCGLLHEPYVGTCGCGRTKVDVQREEQRSIEEEQKQIEEEQKNKIELANIQKLNEYKKLFDNGVITEEEFLAKKKELL